jgi:hypothetical protein
MQTNFPNKGKFFPVGCIRTIYVLGFCFLHLFGFSQTGELEITVLGNSSLKNEKFTYSILHGDTLNSITLIDNTERFEKTHQLNCGIYIIQVYKNDSIYQSYHDIHVDCGYHVNYVINIDQKNSYEIIENTDGTRPEYPDYLGTKIYNKNEMLIGIGYGKGFTEMPEYPLKHYFKGTYGANIIKPFKHHLGLGLQTTSSLAYSRPKKNETFRDPGGFDHERYFLMTMDFGLFLRLTTYNQQKYFDKGTKVDVGIKYNFPFFFRHVVIYGNHKDMTRYIHRYNDVSAFVRIGTKYVSAFMEYRIFDYVKEPFPQNPVITIGIALTIVDI